MMIMDNITYFQTLMNELNILRMLIRTRKIYLMDILGMRLYFQMKTEIKNGKIH